MGTFAVAFSSTLTLLDAAALFLKINETTIEIQGVDELLGFHQYIS